MALLNWTMPPPKQIEKEIKKCLNDYYRLFDNFVVSFFLGHAATLLAGVMSLHVRGCTNCSAPCILSVILTPPSHLITYIT